ncbi:MAG: DUF362 domain-containing protein [Agathobacter sp.]|nr:DUF362 domain-containing protein [Agathobacter sp.]
MTADVAIIKTDVFHYPDNITFRPDKKYPEYMFGDDLSDHNHVYEMVREGFYKLGLDAENYGSEQWNPLKNIVKPGDVVLIKPNMVMDKNAGGFGTECLYTHPSVVAPIIDYVLKALAGTGEIIVGDAPVQSCNFDSLIKESHYNDLIEYYQSKTNIKIYLKDFRDVKSIRQKNGLSYSTQAETSSGKVIDLGKESAFSDKSEAYFDKLRITNYDPNILKLHHDKEKHEYCINEDVLRADVIINVPKPKTHRKAGVTIALKNMVGISARKEYLPHHANGSKEEGGDEFLHSSKLKNLKDDLLDKRNYYMQTEKNYVKAGFFQNSLRILNQIIKRTQKDSYSEGSWYGNDTICRTIIDLNKIIFYADKNGHMCDKMQRKYFIVADMIISGEKEGPLLPSPKDVGIIAMGENPVCFDDIVATIMGAMVEHIPTLVHAKNNKSKYTFLPAKEANIVSNDERWNNKTIKDMNKDSILFFKPSDGWREVFVNKCEE